MNQQLALSVHTPFNHFDIGEKELDKTNDEIYVKSIPLYTNEEFNY